MKTCVKGYIQYDKHKQTHNRKQTKLHVDNRAVMSTCRFNRAGK